MGPSSGSNKGSHPPRLAGRICCVRVGDRARRFLSRPCHCLPNLDLSRERLKTVAETPQALRDLSLSLDNVAEVERDLGNLEAARTASHESLELRRRLREAVGDTPQALRDLSISRDNVGRVERDLGNLEAARTAYRESLDIARRLREAVG